MSPAKLVVGDLIRITFGHKRTHRQKAICNWIHLGSGPLLVVDKIETSTTLLLTFASDPGRRITLFHVRDHWGWCEVLSTLDGYHEPK
jgi:hypothetical protein